MRFFFTLISLSYGWLFVFKGNWNLFLIRKCIKELHQCFNIFSFKKMNLMLFSLRNEIDEGGGVLV